MVICIGCGKRASKRSLSQGTFCEECLENHLKSNPDKESYEEIRYTLSDLKKDHFVKHAKFCIELYEEYIVVIENAVLKITKKFDSDSDWKKEEIEIEKNGSIERIKKKILKIKTLCNLKTFTYAEFQKVKKIIKTIPIYNVEQLENYQHSKLKKAFENILLKPKIYDLEEELCADLLFCKIKFPLIESNNIPCITLTQDKKYLCSAYDNGEMCIWDLASGSVYKYLNTNIEIQNSATLNMNSRTFIFCGQDNKIYGWNIDTDKEEFQLSGHTDEILFTKLSKNEQYLASKSKDSTIKIWDLTKREEICSITLQTDEFAEIPSMDFWKNDEYFVYPNMNISFWNIAKNELEKTINEEGMEVISLAIGSDGKKLVYIDRGLIKVWNLNKWKDVTEGDPKEIPSLSLHDLEVSSDYKYAFINTGSSKGVFVWSILEGKEISRLSEREGDVYIPESFNKVVLTNEKKMFVETDSLIITYDLFEKDDLSLIGFPTEAEAMVSRNIKYCAVITGSGERGVAFIYNLEKGALVSSFLINTKVSRSFIITNCGNYIILNLNNKPQVIFNVKSPKKLNSLDPKNSEFDNEIIPSFSNLSGVFGSVSNDQQCLLIYGPKSFGVWRLHDYKLLFHKSKVKNIWFSPDMTYAITFGFNDNLIYWNTHQKKAEIKISESAYSIKYYSKIHMIVFYSNYHYVFWDCKAKKEFTSIKLNTSRAYDVSATGKLAFIASDCRKMILRYNLEDLSNQTLCPFDVKEGKNIELLSLTTDDSLIALATSKDFYIYDFIYEAHKIKISSNIPPISLAFVPDNRCFLLGFRDGCIALWDSDVNEEVWSKKIAESAVVSLEISEDNVYGAIKLESSICAVWDLKNGSILDINGLVGGQEFRFSADGKSVIVVDKRLVAKVYDIKTASKIGETDLLERERRFFDGHPEFMEFRNEYKELSLED